jgi:hypothetical protein
VLLPKSAYQPIPVFARPVVRLCKALHPSAVVEFG